MIVYGKVLKNLCMNKVKNTFFIKDDNLRFMVVCFDIYNDNNMLYAVYLQVDKNFKRYSIFMAKKNISRIDLFEEIYSNLDFDCDFLKSVYNTLWIEAERSFS